MNISGRERVSVRSRAERAYTIAEVMIAVLLVAISTLALYAAFSHGFAVIQSARENLRATQIMVKRMETIRLYTWSQLLDTNNYLKPVFSEYYDPLGGSQGVKFHGNISSRIPSDLPIGYRTNMRTITVTLNWTNSLGKRPIVRSRQMETRIARRGMQNYIYGQ